MAHWMAHVKKTMKQHPGMSLRDALKVAKKTYHKKGMRGGADAGGGAVGDSVPGGAEPYGSVASEPAPVSSGGRRRRRTSKKTMKKRRSTRRR